MIYQWILDKMKRKNVIIMLVGMVLCQLLLYATPFENAFDGAMGIPNLMMFSSVEAFYDVLKFQSSEGLNAFAYMLLIDMFIPVFYGYLYSTLLVWLLDDLTIHRVIKYILVELPLFAAVANIIANIGNLSAIMAMPSMAAGALTVAVIATSAKYVLIAPAIIAVVVVSIYKITKRLMAGPVI